MSVNNCSPEGNYDILFTCSMESTVITDIQQLTITNNDLQVSSCPSAQTVDRHSPISVTSGIAY